MSSKATLTSAISEPFLGTLMWIGPRRHPEMIDAYRDCESRAAQLAYRVDMEDACQRPAQNVASVIFARPERSRIAPERLEYLKQFYANAKFVCMLSSGCEGEMRTGDPWPGCQRIYWHRWNQDRGAVVADPISVEPTVSSDRALPSLFLAIVASSIQHAEPLLAVASDHCWPATWITPGKIPFIRAPTHVLWDDSAAQSTDRQTWHQRLSLFPSRVGSSADCRLPLHGWLAGFPRIHDWKEARAAGVDWLLSKPASLSAVVRFVAAVN